MAYYESRSDVFQALLLPREHKSKKGNVFYSNSSLVIFRSNGLILACNSRAGGNGIRCCYIILYLSVNVIYRFTSVLVKIKFFSGQQESRLSSTLE